MMDDPDNRVNLKNLSWEELEAFVVTSLRGKTFSR